MKCGCKIKFIFETCLVCNSIIQNCPICITEIVSQFFNIGDSINISQNAYKFAKILNTDFLFCKRCVMLGLFQNEINQNDNENDNIKVRKINYLIKKQKMKNQNNF
jgi:hypothetical protein